MVSKSVAAIIVILSLGTVLSTSAVTPAAADPGAFVAGVIGGTALGAIAAGAAPRYYPAPVYAAPVEYGPGPDCWVERRPVLDPYGRVVGFRPTRVCE